MAGIYRSTSSEAKLHALYAEGTDGLGCPVESRYIRTPYGLTHVLVTGAPKSPVAEVFHGGNFLNPYSLSWMLPALAGFQVFAPDTGRASWS